MSDEKTFLRHILEYITGTRDLLIHAYFSIDLDLVWKIIEKDLQPLKTTIEKILKE